MEQHARAAVAPHVRHHNRHGQAVGAVAVRPDGCRDGGDRGNGRVRHLPGLLPPAGITRHRRPRSKAADGLRPRQLRGTAEVLGNHAQHPGRCVRGDGDGAGFRLPDGLDSQPHQCPVPAHPRTGHGGPLLRHAPAGRPGLEPARCPRKWVRQPGLAIPRRHRRDHRHHHPARHRLGHGAVRGLRRLRHDRRRHEVDGSGAGGGVANQRRRPFLHDAAGHPAAGHPRRPRRRHLRVRRDAGVVLRRTGTRHAGALLRHHHGDLSARRPVSAAYPAGGRAGGVAVRGDVPDAVHLPANYFPAQLCNGQRQGVPAAPDRCRRPALGAVRRLRPAMCCCPSCCRS